MVKLGHPQNSKLLNTLSKKQSVVQQEPGSHNPLRHMSNHSRENSVSPTPKWSTISHLNALTFAMYIS